MSDNFSFPNFAQMYPDEKRWLKRLREYLRYQARTLLYRKQCADFTQFVNQHKAVQTLMEQNLYRVNPLLSVYCDKAWNVQQRLEAIKQNFTLIEQFLGKESYQTLISTGRIALSELTEDLVLYLNVNQIDPFEGYFSLNIQDQHLGKTIYDASFTLLAPNKLLIASIQGPKGEDAQDLVRNATKQLHGMRPMFMLVNAFKALSQQWQCELLGIPHKRQGKYRWNDSERLLFNYDAFWQENAGQLTQNYWQLPLEIERKPLEEIQSKKRSMYRKRYEMFERLGEGVTTQLVK